AAGLAGSFASQIWDVALLRYNTDGTLDLPFGGTNTGMVITDIGSSSNYANAGAIQGDGKTVVVGNAFVNSFAGTSDIAVLRYNTDGSPDTAGFGIPNGYVTTNVSAFDNGFAVAVQPDNNIVVAGNADAGMGDRLALLRYTSNGSLDSNFGTGGIVTRAAPGPSTIAGAFGVVLQPQPGGEIVVAGYDSGPVLRLLALWFSLPVRACPGSPAMPPGPGRPPWSAPRTSRRSAPRAARCAH